MTQLAGKVVLVTGGARGQGRTHALALAAEGAHVVVCDIAEQIPTVPYALATPADLAQTVELIRAAGGSATGAVCDVRDSAQVGRLVDDIVAEHGRIDVLIANAAVTQFVRVVDIDDAT